jgi:small subunit ribosomal protein S20
MLDEASVNQIYSDTYISMPIIKRAIKKLRHDRKRSVQNSKTKVKLRLLIKTMRKKPSAKALKGAFQALDKAAKKHIIHPNKASRLKSRLAKLVK